MKCERVEELLIDYLEGEMEPSENKLVEIHLQSCHDCSKKFSEFKEIRSAFQSEILPQPSQKVLETLTIKAKQDLSKEKISFWKKWFYSPVLIPTLTTALALMIWIDYKDSNQPQFDDNAEIYSREVMAEKIPQGGKAIGNFRAADESSGRKQNEVAPSSEIAVGERRRDIAEAPSVRDEFSERQFKSENKELKESGSNAEVAFGILGINAESGKVENTIDADKQFQQEQYNKGQREALLDNLKKKESDKYANQALNREGFDDGSKIQPKPQAPADPNKQDDDGFRFSLGSSKVMAKKVHKPSGDIGLDTVVGDNKELADEEGLDNVARAKISEQVRSAEKESQISKDKLEDGRLIAVDSPKEILDKSTLRQLNVALNQQKSGDCESAIITNENNIKNIPTAPDEIKEQTYLSLAQCYEQQNKYAKAIENYNYLQQVAPSQTIFATKKIQELNFKVQSLKNLDTLSEPSRSSETEVEVTK